MDKTIYKIKIVFQEELLGAQARNDIASKFNRQRLEDEVVPEDIEVGTTTFHRDPDGNPILMNYQVKGFLKNAAAVVNQLGLFKTKALKSKVENTVFVTPRIIKLEFPEGTEISHLERPASLQTAQGPRVALLRSESLPAGTSISFTVEILEGSQITEEMLRTFLEYGEYIGIGQWRNSGKGSFTFTFENATAK